METSRLGDVLGPWEEAAVLVKGDPTEAAKVELVIFAIREAYRIGHEHGRHARIPETEKSFAERLRDNAAES